MFRSLGVAAFACLVAAVPARGQTILTLEDTIARAREQAGSVVVARARVAEAEAALLGAAARFRDNPVFEANAGPRIGGGRTRSEVDIGISQLFETGGQRQARVAGARAAVDRELSDVGEARRLAAFEAALAFLDGIAAGERLRLAEEAASVSRELLTTSERRYQLGDIAAIDLNLARIDAARSTAALRAAQADVTSAAGRLRTLLRLPAGEPVDLRGTLDVQAPGPLDALRAAIDERPVLTALRADLREAEAQIDLGRALRRPDIGLRANYEREETNNVLLGGLTIVLPAFQRGQGAFAAGTARGARVRLELETTRQAAIAELETAYAIHQQRAALAGTLMSDADPSLEDNLNLARRSYDAGELDLMAFLLVRRDALDTRTAIVDRRLEAARSRLLVDHLAGGLR